MKIVKNMGSSYYSSGATPANLSGPVSKSMLWAFHQSPYKWRHGKTKPATDAMAFGTLAHALLLDPKSFDDQFVVSPYDSFRTTEAKAWKADRIAEGKTIVDESDIDRAAELVTVIQDDPQFFGLGDIECEVAVFGAIGTTEVKGMIDIVPLNGNCLVDLKTTTSAITSLQNIQRLIVSRGYHWQAALYLDLYNAATGENRDQFWFLFVEDTEPFETAWISLSDDLIQAGRVAYMNAILRWQKCVATKQWPKAIDGVIEVDLPAWAKQENQ